MADPRQAGFTLVEMIVCLALAALIGTLLVSTIRVAGTASSVVARTVVADEVQSVRDHLRRTLGGLARRRADGTGAGLRGGPDGLSAVVAADQVVERPVERAVTLATIARDDGTFDLVESRTAPERGPDAAEAVQAEVLLDGVSELGIRYFGAQADGARPAWQAAWFRADRLPALVEIQVAFAPGDRRRWPPLLIAVGDRP